MSGPDEKPAGRVFDESVSFNVSVKVETQTVALVAENLTIGSPVFSSAPKLTVYHPLPDKHPFFELIGRVVAEFARLEHALDQIIWGLVGGDPRRLSSVTGQMTGQGQRLSAIQALAAARGLDAAMLKRIQTLSGRVNEAAKLRNRFVHDAWFEPGDAPGAAAQFKSFSAKDRTYGISEITAVDAEETVRLIRDRVADVSQLQRDLLPPT